MTRISLNNPGHQEEKVPEHTLSKQPHTWVYLASSVVGHVALPQSLDWTKACFSFIFLTVKYIHERSSLIKTSIPFKRNNLGL